MSSNVLHKQAAAFALFLIIFLQAAPGIAGERRVPVLRRSPSGMLVLDGSSDLAGVDGARVRKSLPFDLPSRKIRTRRLMGAGTAPAALEGRIRVAILRIGFETNRENTLTSISTDGDFELVPDPSRVIDPTPHNRAYFNAHMQGLDNYCRFQSCGRVFLEWDVLPFGESDSYKLSDIADYGPGDSESWTTDLLAAYVRDAIIAADQGLAAAGYPTRLSEYDVIMIAHPGADLQSDYNADSPNDIPSFHAILGTGDVVTVEGGAAVITEAAVVPESATQDGGIGSLAAVLAHEFGHGIGLPDLYDTYSGISIVGVWDNMDSGPQLGAYVEDDEGNLLYATGIVASGLGAWSRYVLGWTECDTIDGWQEGLGLPAAEKCPSRVTRLAASQTEYFIIENRSVELDDILTGFVVDPATGVVVGTGNCMNCADGVPDEVEWELVNGYDILLPTESEIPSTGGGPGILVWRIEEYFLADRWEYNGINARWPYAVSLIEGSGTVDLGDAYSRYSYGWYDDAFFEGSSTVFSDSTVPYSWSVWNVPMGAGMNGVSARDTLMTFSAGVAELRGSKSFRPLSRIAEGGMMSLPGDRRVLLVDVDGKGWMPGDSSPLFELPTGSFISPPAFAPSFDYEESGDAVIIAERDGRVHALRTDNWGECAGNWPVRLNGLVSHPVVMDLEGAGYVALADSSGTLLLLDSYGSVPAGMTCFLAIGYRFAGNLVAQPASQGSGAAIFALSRHTSGAAGYWLTRYVIGQGEIAPDPLWQNFISLGAGEMDDRAVIVGGDIDPDMEGIEVYLVLMETGRVILVGRDGIISDRSYGSPITELPVLQDVNGDRKTEIISTDGFMINVAGPSGSNITGWPRDINEVWHLPAPVRIGAALAAAGTDEGAWILVGTESGIVFIFDHRGELVGGYPKRIAGSIDQAAEIVASGGENLLLYGDIVYNEGENLFYRFRPQGGTVRWRVSPFISEELETVWSGYWGNPGRTAFSPGSEGFATPPPDWSRLVDNLVIYPNPSRGERIGFHFTAPSSGEAKLEIMTLTGDLVVKRSKSLSGGEDEFVISMDGKASGIYLCRLVIKSGQRSVEARKKFAVVK